MHSLYRERLIHQKEEILVQEIKIPDLAESITEGTIAEWLVKEGDSIEKGDPVVELETDKVNVEVNAEVSGVLAEITAGEGEDVEVGDVIGKVDENAEAGSTPSEPEEKTKEEPKEEKKAEQPKEETPKKEEKTEETAGGSKGEVIASPAARKRARELNIDLSEVSPRDPLGRVRPEDVDAAAKSSNEKASAKSSGKKEANEA